MSMKRLTVLCGFSRYCLYLHEINVKTKETAVLASRLLYLSMMGDACYRGLLYGGISAMLQYNRMPGPMTEILRRSELHDRLFNATDYPLVGVNALIRTKSLQRAGFIKRSERRQLNEIYSCNPILFDFVLKRTVRLPGTDKRLSLRGFSAEIFLRTCKEEEEMDIASGQMAMYFCFVSREY
jgi:hypothetical protein